MGRELGAEGVTKVPSKASGLVQAGRRRKGVLCGAHRWSSGKEAAGAKRGVGEPVREQPGRPDLGGFQQASSGQGSTF